MSEADLESWGWRIPFFIGAAGAVSALWLRRGIEETEAFKHGDHSAACAR
jgi:MHS family alpha-ketoglutarate permease-like MFS transporter